MSVEDDASALEAIMDLYEEIQKEDDIGDLVKMVNKLSMMVGSALKTGLLDI